MKRLKTKLESRRGLTLAELMAAILILAMVTSVAAAGLPTAINAYHGAVLSANAQSLLSTTLIRLREELGTARDVSLSEDGSQAAYSTPEGSRSRIFQVGYGNGEPGIYLTEYENLADTAYTHLLVSRAASSEKLHVEYALPITYAGGVITFGKLSVKNGANEITSVESFQIRVLADRT